MEKLDSDPLQHFIARWLRASIFGWFLGFLLVLGLSVAWESIGGGAQFTAGLGIGMGVGLIQGRTIRGAVPFSAWVLSTSLGMTLPFVAWDLLSWFGRSEILSLPLCTSLGGLIVGLAQVALLKRRYRNPLPWVWASLVGWALPVAVIALGDSDVLPGAFGGFLSLGAMLLGGTLLGAVTAPVMKRILAAPAA